MKQALLLGAVATSVAAVLAVQVAHGDPTAPHRAQTLRLVGIDASDYQIDNAPAGESAGDTYGGSSNLYERGKLVGHEVIACTETSIRGSQCGDTFMLRNGRIDTVGAFAFTRAPQQLAVAGGSGAYSNVRGSATIMKTSEKRGIVTFRLTR
jgi:hypothetical protein